MPTNPNSPAAPAKGETHVGDNVYIDHFHTGLTKREYFASLAMQGILSTMIKAGGSPLFPDHQDTKELLASASVKYADSLIMELNK